MTDHPTIVVGIKQVPDDDEVSIDPDTGRLDRSSAPAVLNRPDRNALEAALGIRDEVGGRVVAMTMGPPPAAEVLEVAVAMGCDDGVLVSDVAFGGSDTWPTSLTLARTVEYLDGDIVVCGEETTDSSTGQVPPGIAAHLGWAQLTYVEELEPLPETGQLAARRDVEGGYERVIADLPVVVAVAFGENHPRPAGLHRKIYAETEFEPVTLDADDLGIDENTVGLAASPTQVGGMDTIEGVERERVTVGTVDELIDELAGTEVLP
ncbi:electron transfer flavoprotein subunit beta/FixA family protein [Natronomonas salina]|uniref:electron transfer flavoprotein subunit beta/FixA family protein n=1 Tax=Natronomonas salina TaxID=1710540 RepID=UPI0015B63930|nr:electron transfer flavoprotein subunit beta/FixA family protein [Natronomonas salina]QLD89563.1 electron transfer flavoprotein subunit beta/FixA family protein [Natronomonas salina]